MALTYCCFLSGKVTGGGPLVRQNAVWVELLATGAPVVAEVAAETPRTAQNRSHLVA